MELARRPQVLPVALIATSAFLGACLSLQTFEVAEEGVDSAAVAFANGLMTAILCASICLFRSRSRARPPRSLGGAVAPQ